MTLEATALHGRLLRGDVSGGIEVQQASAMLGMLMDSLASAVFWKDAESRYLGCNRTFAEFSGLPAEELVGRHDRDMPWANHMAGYLDWDQRVMDEGVARHDILEQFRGIDGVERWISTNKVPIFDLDGAVVGVLGSFRDITDQRNAEQELQESLRALDEKVEERTAELARANAGLRREVEERVRLEAAERRLREYSDTRRRIYATISTATDIEAAIEALTMGIYDLVSADLVAVVLSEDGNDRLATLSSSAGYTPIDNGVAVGRTHIALETPGVPRASTVDEPLPRSFGPARSTVAFPLESGRENLGFLVLESQLPDFYTEGHVDRLTGLLDLTATLISNIRLREADRARIASEERTQLARNLHDSVVQTLAATSLTVEAELTAIHADNPALPAFKRLERLTSNAYLEIRTLLSQTRQQEQVAPLSELLDNVANEFEFGGDIAVNAQLLPVDLDQRTTLEVYRIVQEALHNIDRHARASSVEIDLRNRDGQAVVTVRDNGVGFDQSSTAAENMGLVIMAERAAEVGATLTITSSAGQGTTVCIHTPTTA